MEYLDKLRGRPNLNRFNLQWCLRLYAKCCQRSLQTNNKQCDAIIDRAALVARQIQCKKKDSYFLLSEIKDT